jgi:HAE1 family hydrophobic/amphiphilic exporter-1
MTAAYDGAKEVGFTILSMTLSLTAVFIPILFLGGIVGRLFHEFSVTIAVAILMSGLVSLTLTPMLCSRFLRPPGEERHGALYLAIERAWQMVIGRYERTLRWTMRHRGGAMAFSLGVLVAMGALFVIIPKGFIPSEDTGRINATTEAAQGISFDDMAVHQRELADILKRDTNVVGFMSSIGSGGPSSSGNQGRFFIGMKPRAERVSADKFITEIRARLSRVPGMVVFIQNPPAIQVGGRISKGLYQFTMQSSDLTALYPAAQQLVDSVRKSPLLQDVSSDLQLGNPQASIEINRERASSLGVSAQSIETALYDAYGSRQVSTIYTPNNEYWVIMELLPQYQRDLSALRLLYVRSNTGTLVPLSAVADVVPTNGPLSINHSGQLPSVTISFNLKPGVSLGDAVDTVQQVASATLPSTVSTHFQGTAQAFQDSLQGLGIILAMAIIVIYIVLGILYESFTHPLTILSGLPSAGFGALLTLLVFKTELNLYAFVGVIMLVGLVKKNGIMMVDFAVAEQRDRGRTPLEAIHEACLVRFRPIMMTTMCALVGTLPVALGWGAGAESRRPLGIAVVGGLFFSQFITLFITPVVYTYLDAASSRVKGWMKRRQGIAPSHGAVATGD